MRIVDDGQVEHYTCAMPRYYAIPLILINKHLAFYEAQCHPDGSPLKPSSSGNIRRRELYEYNYLWRLRCRFLQEVFNMNHESRLNEKWRCVRIHGFLYRMYNRFGHDVHQRCTYWRMEIKERRVPYTTPPDVKDMSELPALYPTHTSPLRLFFFSLPQHYKVKAPQARDFGLLVYPCPRLPTGRTNNIYIFTPHYIAIYLFYWDRSHSSLLFVF
jgi:hypothetical protein